MDKFIRELDLYLKMFVDTNIPYLDSFENQSSNSSIFLEDASTSKYINLQISNFVLSECYEYLRMEEWIKYLVEKNLYSKNAREYKIELSDVLREAVENKYTELQNILNTLNIAVIEVFNKDTDENFFLDSLRKYSLNPK